MLHSCRRGSKTRAGNMKEKNKKQIYHNGLITAWLCMP